LLAAVSVLLTLALGEVAMRLRTPPWLYPLDPPEDSLMVEDPVRGYGLRPNYTEQWVREHSSVRVEINADGIRDEPIAQARKASLRVLAVGDSYTFGIGVEQAQTWPEVLERDLAQRTGRTTAVVNAGVPGYSARQIRVTAEQLLDRVEPAWVIAALYARSYWRVKEPYAVYGGALVLSRHLPQLVIAANHDLIFTPFRPGALRDLDIWLKGHTQLGARILHRLGPFVWPDRLIEEDYPDRLKGTDADYQPVFDELAQLQSELAERRVPLVLVLVNQQEADGSFLPQEFHYNELVTHFCSEHHLPLVDPLPRFIAEAKGAPVIRIPSDNHWSPFAQRIAAQEVESMLESLGLIPRA
jgi:hypothetical protein